MRPRGDEPAAPGQVRTIDGGEDLTDIVMVDQAPLAKSPRSTPAVYLGAYDAIRQLFGSRPEAVSAGLTAALMSAACCIRTISSTISPALSVPTP